MNRTDLQRLTQERLDDAKVLLGARRWSAAYYLSGYAVECALKACIARWIQAEEFPDKNLADRSWTHNLQQLFAAAGLKDDFAAALRGNLELSNNWDVVKDWSEASRYARVPRGKAENLYAAITDKKHGVLSWLKRRW